MYVCLQTLVCIKIKLSHLLSNRFGKRGYVRLGAEVVDVKKFSEKVRKRRHQIGLTQLDLSEKSGLHLNHISKIERNRTDPSLSTMLRIARALGVKLKDLIPD